MGSGGRVLDSRIYKHCHTSTNPPESSTKIIQQQFHSVSAPPEIPARAPTKSTESFLGKSPPSGKSPFSQDGQGGSYQTGTPKMIWWKFSVSAPKIIRLYFMQISILKGSSSGQPTQIREKLKGNNLSIPKNRNRNR